MTDDESPHADLGYSQPPRPAAEHTYACGHAVERGHVAPATAKATDCGHCDARAAAQRSTIRTAARCELLAQPPIGPEQTAIAHTRLVNSGHDDSEATEFLRKLAGNGGKRRAG